MDKLSSSLYKRDKSPEDEKPRRKHYQPRQKSNTRRFNSTNLHMLTDSDPKKVFSTSGEFPDNPLRLTDRYLNLYNSLRPKVKKSKKHSCPRRLSPYSKTNIITLGDRSPKPVLRHKNRQKVDLESIQNYFFEFQVKSKLLLKQLEKSVLG